MTALLTLTSILSGCFFLCLGLIVASPFDVPLSVRAFGGGIAAYAIAAQIILWVAWRTRQRELVKIADLAAASVTAVWFIGSFDHALVSGQEMGIMVAVGALAATNSLAVRRLVGHASVEHRQQKASNKKMTLRIEACLRRWRFGNEGNFEVRVYGGKLAGPKFVWDIIVTRDSRRFMLRIPAFSG